jgi:hypothetical protein
MIVGGGTLIVTVYRGLQNKTNSPRLFLDTILYTTVGAAFGGTFFLFFLSERSVLSLFEVRTENRIKSDYQVKTKWFLFLEQTLTNFGTCTDLEGQEIISHFLLKGWRWKKKKLLFVRTSRFLLSPEEE